MRRALATLFLLAACPGPAAPPPTPVFGVTGGADAGGATPVLPSGRELLVPNGHPLFARVEGTAFANGCATDSGCVAAGCAGEVCSADPGAMTSCEAAAWPHLEAPSACGCVGGTCRWYRREVAIPPPPPPPLPPPPQTNPAPPLPPVPPTSAPSGVTAAQGMPCLDLPCAAGLICLRYYGIAGPRGPSFATCEIPCPTGGACPAGQRCLHIADGPGSVCR